MATMIPGTPQVSREVADPRTLPNWPGLSKTLKRLMLARYARIGLHAAELPTERPSIGRVFGPRSIATAGVPTNIRVNNPAEDAGAGNHTTQSEPSLAVRMPDVCVTFNDSNPVAGFSGYSNSTDAGFDFTDDVDLTTSASDGGDSVLAVDRSGTVYAVTMRVDASFIGYIDVLKSTDGGSTFGAPVDVGAAIQSAGDSMDKPWIAVDTSGGPNDGAVYVAWTRFLAGGTATIVTRRSVDGGATWSVPQTISGSSSGFSPQQGASIAVAADGTVYIAWLDRAGSQILIRRSTDGGITYANPVAGGGAAASLTQIPDPLNGNIGATSFPSCAVGPNGNVYVTYAGSSGIDQANVYLVRSTDQGQHFSMPLRANDDATTTDQWMPSVAVASNGTVGVMFYDRRNDWANSLIDVYIALSIDDGQTFLANQRVTETSFPPAVNFETDRIRGDYMGDYNHMVAVGTRFHMVWGDNRDSVGTRHDPNVFYASVGTEDCFVRDSPADDGYAPSAAGQAWQSPDILPTMNPSIFGTPNPVQIQVHNFGPKAAASVTTRLYWADPATYIPRAAWRPDRIRVETSPGVYTNTNEQVIASVPAAGTANPPQAFIWDPPEPDWATENGHFCLLAELESAGDPLTFPGAGGWQTIERDNNLAVRNVHVQPMGHGPRQIRFFIGAEYERELLTDLVIDARHVPFDLAVALRIDPMIAARAKLSGGLELQVLDKGDDRETEDQREDKRERGLEYVPTPVGRIRLQGRRIHRIAGLLLPPGKGSLAALDLALRDGEKLEREASIRLTQRIEGQVAGGLLYLIRP